MPTDYRGGESLVMKALHGSEISKDEAVRLERHVADDPSDIGARALLLGYYQSRDGRSKRATRNLIEHILWMIENAPACGLGQTPYLRISSSEHPVEYQKFREILINQCDRFEGNLEIIADLACLFLGEEPEIAVRYLRKAQAMDQKNYHTTFWLSRALYNLGEMNNDLEAFKDAVLCMQQVVAAEKPDPTFDYRFWLARMAFKSEEFDLATKVCQELLSDRCADSQAIHTAHTVLGSIAFHQNDIPAAVEHLLCSGRVGESPRLISYGPMMQLAQQLLEAGQREAVTQFLTDCKQFWELGKSELPKWLREIEAGKTPELKGDHW